MHAVARLRLPETCRHRKSQRAAASALLQTAWEQNALYCGDIPRSAGYGFPSGLRPSAPRWGPVRPTSAATPSAPTAAAPRVTGQPPHARGVCVPASRRDVSARPRPGSHPLRTVRMGRCTPYAAAIHPVPRDRRRQDTPGHCAMQCQRRAPQGLVHAAPLEATPVRPRRTRVMVANMRGAGGWPASLPACSP